MYVVADKAGMVQVKVTFSGLPVTAVGPRSPEVGQVEVVPFIVQRIDPAGAVAPTTPVTVAV